MEMLIWIGTAVTLVGLVLLIWCIREVAKAKRAADDEEALRVRLQSVLPINLGALGLSAMGLMLVVLGIVFS